MLRGAGRQRVRASAEAQGGEPSVVFTIHRSSNPLYYAGMKHGRDIWPGVSRMARQQRVSADGACRAFGGIKEGAGCWQGETSAPARGVEPVGGNRPLQHSARPESGVDVKRRATHGHRKTNLAARRKR